MAPNLRKVELLTSDGLENVGALVRNKVALSVSRAVAEEVPCVSYWDWPAQDEEQRQVDIFSASHIEANLVQEASKASSSGNLVAEHDDYWAESSSAPLTITTAMPLHRQPQEPSVSYWDEDVHETTAADTYWQGNTTSYGRHCHGPSADNYWNEACHEQTASDLYWRESSRDSSCSYWQEASHAQTASDQYWSMVAR
mmetsp:Transcript_25096/g.47664  ORF Transcript_25096/g.47664 Transcript_25096/m.47664 type:complete len:198 (-) Transcript_25096:83-676(-)